MPNTEYTYDNLPLVIQESEVNITGTGDATIMHANTVNVYSGLLRVHGTSTTTPIYVNAYGDAIVLIYGNVAVNAREASRIYGYNNAYVVTRDNSSAEIFGSGVLVTNDNSQGILYDTAEAISHGNSRILLYGNSSAVAMDASILSVRDASYAITRGYSQAYIYDNASTTSYDTSSITVNSPLVQVEARNASTISLNEQLEQHVRQEGRYLLFENPANTNEVIGQIHLTDEATILGEVQQIQNDSYTPDIERQNVETEDETAQSATEPSQIEEMPTSSNVTEQIDNAQSEIFETQQDEKASATKEPVNTTVADLLARARKAKPQFAEEPDLTPEPIKATPKQETNIISPLQNENDNKNLIANDSHIENESLSSSFTVDLSDNDEEPVPETDFSQDIDIKTVEEVANTVNTSETQTINTKPQQVISGSSGSEITAPQGDTAIDQLNNQGWYVLTEPTGKQVDFEYTEPRDDTNSTSGTVSPSSNSASEKKITGGFDFDDEEEEDEFIPTILGQR